ncbi:aldehyde dehydrogenase (NADP(+)) [Dactylosporangium fulvum]|uniref:Aldehyde dehydrogenase (NADP(+)) n=1 Tax=Dactylosporangium fulvum TaxID=53359 RepID=A0ABY5W789_9ACTN|nr:aldehyde dehydrogenase (NADP(+)) [Dactylosporangium fulvum]UWP85314.1 aldehyde dehydrogenase (NADP(+)) [Dactylosporangium fulvum]
MSRVNSVDVRTGASTPTAYVDSDAAEVDRVCRAAAATAGTLDGIGRAGRATLLERMAHTLDDDRDGIVAVADRETGLGPARLNTELTRTCLQLRLFAEVVTDGGYVEAVVDGPADTPIGPRPDLRRMLVPVGPVAVFGASNFPLAFSVPGGDTASALAAGCPVVVKAHPAHPATSGRCLAALRRALRDLDLPEEIVSLVFGRSAGRWLVEHPLIQAVGFTGSTAGGRALFDLANRRPSPIPFHGELGSLNPLVVTPGAAAGRGAGIAAGYAASVTMGMGQFCTKPGLLFLPAGAAGDAVLDRLVDELEPVVPGVLLSAAIRDAYADAVAGWRADPRTTVVAERAASPGAGFTAGAVVLSVAAAELADTLLEEVFGPAALVVRYRDTDELCATLGRLGGQLTATVHSAEGERELLTRLHGLLRGIAGRLIFDGFPTGVAVAWAQHHGGPYPATTAPAHTSVGATSIRRWLRPVTYQNAPDYLLPEELRDGDRTVVPMRRNGSLEATA